MENKAKIYNIDEQHYRSDERGWNLMPLVPEFPGISDKGHLHIVSLEPGVVRGNHAHTTTDEWIVFWGGKTLLVWEEEGERKEEMLDGDKAYLVYLPAHIMHACKNVGNQTSFLFAYYETRIMQYDKETVRKILVT